MPWHLPYLLSNSFVMRFLFLISFLLFAQHGQAQTLVTVDSASTNTLGLGGSAQIGYAFAKGDVVTIEAKASKQLDRMMVYRFPQEVIGRVKLTKHPKLTFTMEQDGIVVCRFISDRDGSNNISYVVTRMPATAALQNYNTKVTWQPPSDHPGEVVPKRVEGD
jgi:hypothetical protein